MRLQVTLLVSGIDGALAGQVKTLSGTFSSALKTRLHWAGDSSWIDKLSTTIVPPFKNTTCEHCMGVRQSLLLVRHERAGKLRSGAQPPQRRSARPRSQLPACAVQGCNMRTCTCITGNTVWLSADPCLWNPRSVLEILDNLTLCTDVEDRYFFGE